MDEVFAYLDKILENKFLSVFIFTLLFILIWIIITNIIKSFKKRSHKKLKDPILINIIYTSILWILRIVLITAYANVVGIDTAGLAALVASVGVAIGLALQGSLGNLAGGIVILITRPFRYGDYVIIEDKEGIVEDIKLFYTHIVTFDNAVVLIPNGKLANNVIVNNSKKEIRRVEIKFQISYFEDLSFVENEILAICEKNQYVLDNPLSNVVLLKKEKGITFIELRAWSKTEYYFDAYYSLIRQIYGRFNELKIEIPNEHVNLSISNTNYK